MTSSPTLNDVLYLLADNGYSREVDGGALGVNRDAWSDERLLRTFGRREYQHRRYRLMFAVKNDDVGRVIQLSEYAGASTIQSALHYAVCTGGCLAIAHQLAALCADMPGTLRFFYRSSFLNLDQARSVHLPSRYRVESGIVARLANSGALALRCGNTAMASWGCGTE